MELKAWYLPPQAECLEEEGIQEHLRTNVRVWSEEDQQDLHKEPDLVSFSKKKKEKKRLILLGHD